MSSQASATGVRCRRAERRPSHLRLAGYMRLAQGAFPSWVRIGVQAPSGRFGRAISPERGPRIAVFSAARGRGLDRKSGRRLSDLCYFSLDRAWQGRREGINSRDQGRQPIAAHHQFSFRKVFEPGATPAESLCGGDGWRQEERSFRRDSRRTGHILSETAGAPGFPGLNRRGRVSDSRGLHRRGRASFWPAPPGRCFVSGSNPLARLFPQARGQDTAPTASRRTACGAGALKQGAWL